MGLPKHRNTPTGAPAPERGTPIQEGVHKNLGTEKTTYANTIKIASINIQTIKEAGKRKDIEQWVKRTGINIVALQETKANNNSKETRKEYTWFFGGDQTKTHTDYGMGFIRNDWLQHIEDIEPIDDRIMLI